MINPVTTKELRKLIRETPLENLKNLIYNIKGDILVKRRGNVKWMFIQDIEIFDDGIIKCYESPAWSVMFRSKKLFSYNVKLREEKF